MSSTGKSAASTSSGEGSLGDLRDGARIAGLATYTRSQPVEGGSAVMLLDPTLAVFWPH
ncbi:MAG TPA: hypothetical protein VK306_14250 [Acidimicrobiales bacterium]|nr:hypothetical protein [Acidimicrobiales bacterium]